MTKTSGYIKVPREILHEPIWCNPYDCTLYMYCVLHASHNHYKSLAPGEFYTSKLKIIEELHWSRNTLKEHLRRLEESGMIVSTALEDRTLIRVLHWEDTFGSRQRVVNDQIMTTNRQQMTNNCQVMTAPLSAFDHNQEDNQENQDATNERARAFEDWWVQYPRQDQKAAARKRWMALVDISPERLTAALVNAMNSRQWLEEDGRYIPSAASWLDGLWKSHDRFGNTPPKVRKDGNPVWENI